MSISLYLRQAPREFACSAEMLAAARHGVSRSIPFSTVSSTQLAFLSSDSATDHVTDAESETIAISSSSQSIWGTSNLLSQCQRVVATGKNEIRSSNIILSIPTRERPHLSSAANEHATDADYTSTVITSSF